MRFNLKRVSGQLQSSCPKGATWTSWFDDDNQFGNCDCEILSNLRKKHRICERPVGIEARAIGSRVIYKSHQRNIKISPTYGFSCWNTRYSRCKDYEVRFCCPFKGKTFFKAKWHFR